MMTMMTTTVMMTIMIDYRPWRTPRCISGGLSVSRNCELSMETKKSNRHYCYFGIQSKGPSNYHQIFQGITKAGAAHDSIDLPVSMELAYANPIIHLKSFDDCNIGATSSFMFIRNATQCKTLQFPTYPSFPKLITSNHFPSQLRNNNLLSCSSLSQTLSSFPHLYKTYIKGSTIFSQKSTRLNKQHQKNHQPFPPQELSLV